MCAMLLQAFVPTHNLTTTNETAIYEDSHLVHTGQFFNTDLMNSYVSFCISWRCELWLPCPTWFYMRCPAAA